MENRKKLLDEDMNMKERVAEINRYRIIGILGEVAPYVQLDEEEINKIRLGAPALRQIIENKASAEQIHIAMDGAGPIDTYPYLTPRSC